MFLASFLRRFFRHGRLILVDASGNRHQICGEEGPTVVFRLVDSATQRRLLRTDSITWGEAYMDGKLIIEEGSLPELLEIFERSDADFQSTWFGRVVRMAHGLVAATAHYNPIGKSRRNVAHHYDLSSRLYDLFLDADRQYSCAYFHRGDEDIDTAQLKKKRHIAAKLDIRPGMHVLDIGSGWGGMALYLARQFDCRVTGVTLSEEQLKISRLRAREAGLDRRVNFELQDYRALDQVFDRIVSVGMLEHVGPYHYDEYFSQLRKLLTADGVALVHTIARKNSPQPVGAWIRKYIFPGGYIPAASQLTRALENHQLWLTDMENLRLHYARTLQLWHRRFSASRNKVVKIYDERFCRMWELYLLGCEAAFRYGNLCVLQLQITGDIDTLPITRDYMFETERNLALKDQASVTSIKPGDKARKSADSLRAM